MNLRRLNAAACLALLAAVTGSDRAMATNDWGTHASSYWVTALPSAGGTMSRGNSINNLGWVAGFADQPDGLTRHATVWLYGWPLDLGTLGGPNSNIPWPVKNNLGLFAGIAQTNEPEPLGQNWSCSAFFPAATAAGHICSAVVWKHGQSHALPTLGGYNSFATGANHRGDVVGVSCSTTACRAFVHRNGVMRDLNELVQPGFDGVLATAQDINDAGVVTGRAFFPASGKSKPFVAIPVPGLRETSSAQRSVPADIVFPEAVMREMLHPLSRDPH